MEQPQTKRRRGRPAIGTAVAVRLPPDLVVKLDAFAEANWSASRSDAVRALLQAALNGGQTGALQAQLAALAAAAAKAAKQIQEVISVAQRRRDAANKEV
jgi:metal-responsive CopG/Arc/MetJ family transcriptional regulator